MQETRSRIAGAPNEQVAAAERRVHRRKPTLWEGRIDTDMGAFACVVLNISQGGAMLQADVPRLDTPRATLMIERFGTLGATVVWQFREEGKIGIRFTDPPERVQSVLLGALPL